MNKMCCKGREQPLLLILNLGLGGITTLHPVQQCLRFTAVQRWSTQCSETETSTWSVHLTQVNTPDYLINLVEEFWRLESATWLTEWLKQKGAQTHSTSSECWYWITKTQTCRWVVLMNWGAEWSLTCLCWDPRTQQFHWGRSLHTAPTPAEHKWLASH